MKQYILVLFILTQAGCGKSGGADSGASVPVTAPVASAKRTFSFQHVQAITCLLSAPDGDTGDNRLFCWADTGYAPPGNALVGISSLTPAVVAENNMQNKNNSLRLAAYDNAVCTWNVTTNTQDCLGPGGGSTANTYIQVEQCEVLPGEGNFSCPFAGLLSFGGPI